MVFEKGKAVRSVRDGRLGYVLDSNPELTRVLFVGATAPEMVATSSLADAGRGDDELLAHDQFLNLLTAYKLTSQLSDVVYGYLASRTQFRPYQFLPVLRFLESPIRRLLIADEVGLGKTIEAGLIWLELAARGQAERVLVVCPSQLREKWRRELDTRFDIEATVIQRGEELDQIITDIDLAPERASRPRHLIVSLDVLARDCAVVDEWMTRGEALATSGIVWDLVVVDEAHHARNASTKRHDALAALGAAVEAQVFLTATPLNLGTPDLYTLLRLLDPARFRSFDAFVDEIEPAKHVTAATRAVHERDIQRLAQQLESIARGAVGARLRRTVAYRQARSLLGDPDVAGDNRKLALLDRAVRDLHPLAGVFTRTRKRDLTEPFARRTVWTVDVEWSASERAFYDAVMAAAREAQKQTENPFAIVMPARQSASCLPVMADRVRQADSSYDPDEGLEAADGGPSGWLKAASGPTLHRLRQALEALGGDTKFDAFRARLEQLFAGEVRQALVFSFFRGTVSYLRRRLVEIGFTVEVMHGGVPLSDRYRTIDRFRAGEFQILISTEVGAEGLDFEFCACLVNYDLPWNPMRVEQRIGRLDRFGQQNERIIIANFRIPGTIETDIFERLYERIGVFRDSIGDLDDILGAELEEKALALATTLRLTPEERARHVEELALSFERRRAQLEDLEAHRELLASSEELLSDEFEQIRSTGRAVLPGEIEILVRSYLEAHYPKTRWEPRPEGALLLQLDPEMVEGAGPLGEALLEPGLRQLRQRAELGLPIACTFKADTASRRHDLEFITARHPLTSAIARQTAQGRFPAACSLRLTTDQLPPGRFDVAIYEAVTRSVDVRKRLVPIAAATGTDERAVVVEERLFGVLGQRGNGIETAIAEGVDRTVLQRLVAGERSALEYEARIEADLQLERRKRSLRATFEPKIELARSNFDKTRGTRLEAANRARLRNLEERYRQTKRDLDRARSPEVSLREIAYLAVEVVPESEGGFERAERERQALQKSRATRRPHPTGDAAGSAPQNPDGPDARCSACDMANGAWEVPEPEDGERCGRCGQPIVRRCGRCGRFVTAAGCRAAALAGGLTGQKFATVLARTSAANLHFTTAEIHRTMSRGRRSRETFVARGQPVSVIVYRLGSAVVSARRDGTIFELGRSVVW